MPPTPPGIAVPPAVASPPAASPAPGQSGRADLALALWMVGLTAIWGLNAVSVKVITAGVSPVMAATLRNGLAIALLAAYGLLRGHRFFGDDRAVRVHVVFNALLFAAEFICAYSGARLSNAGHFAVFLNTSPFVVAIGAHFLFPHDRLYPLKAVGLLGAFAGVVLLFGDGLLHAPAMWRGDLLIFAAALFWGTSTLHIKRFILGKLTPFQLLFAKLLVSTPLMLAYSRWTEPDPFFGFDTTSMLMLAYQGGVVVFFSYLMFIVMLERYQPSAVQSFTFLSPVWGVLAGVALLGERLSLYLAGGMALVGLGLYLINRPRRTSKAAVPA